MSRKERKQARKRKGVPEEKVLIWITNAEIRKISDEMTRKATERARSLPLHDRFFCKKCDALYCLNNDGKVVYCKECYFGIKPKEETKGCTWAGCIKKVQDIRTCENH